MSTIPANARCDQPPPWLDTVTLAWHLCISPETIPNWVAAGILPPPRKRGGKLMWRWTEVDTRLAEGDNGRSTEAAGIRDAVRKEREADSVVGH